MFSSMSEVYEIKSFSVPLKVWCALTIPDNLRCYDQYAWIFLRIAHDFVAHFPEASQSSSLKRVALGRDNGFQAIRIFQGTQSFL